MMHPDYHRRIEEQEAEFLRLRQLGLLHEFLGAVHRPEQGFAAAEARHQIQEIAAQEHHEIPVLLEKRERNWELMDEEQPLSKKRRFQP